ncbi:hypothetical protein [Flavobacterium sp.]|uniref:hypothetical protein n=1 Tax=Flavobacterium sp. TaxID=239 RepID=UPI00352796E3
MKKILAMALLATTVLAGAQEKGEKADRMKQRLTVEERTELQVKHMTLELDLDSKQQEQIKALMLEAGKEKEAKREAFKAKKDGNEKPSKEEMLKMKNDRLDSQIEMKAKLKAILTEKQYEKWENSQSKRRENAREHMKENRGNLKMGRKKTE